MKIIGVIHARMSSSRLPGKVLKDLGGRSVLYHHYERLSQCKALDAIYLATSKDEINAPLIAEARKYSIPYYAGADEDLLERYLAIAKKEKADAVVRCGCDKPLVSYEIVDHLLAEYKGEDLLYVTTVLPAGIGSEILSVSALEKVRKHYRGPAMSRYIHEYPHKFKIRGVEVDDVFSRPEVRLALDTEEDYRLLKTLCKLFYAEGKLVDLREVFKYLDDHPDLANINRSSIIKEVNTYVAELSGKPVFSVYQTKAGKFVVKNRMGEGMSKDEFLGSLDKMEWEE
jgi:spore coat polysaccharide biosynthesis protein SpsF